MANAVRPNPVTNCPLTATVAAVGGKWKLIIVYCLAESPKHFAGLRQGLPGVSQKVLAQQLRELMGDGIVARARTGKVPAPVIYSLTDYGHSLEPLLEQVLVWGRAHIRRAEEASAGEPRRAATEAIRINSHS
jgi:DNA-binding HxlR family transcriptional regulator